MFEKLLKELIISKIEMQNFINVCRTIYDEYLKNDYRDYEIQCLSEAHFVHLFAYGNLSEEELYEEAKLCDEVLNNQRKYVYTFFCRLKRRDNVDILSDDVRDKEALNKLRDKYLLPVEEVCTIYDILHNTLHAMLDELDDGIYSSINCPDITEIEIVQRINKTLAYINGEDAMLLQFTYGNCDKTIITLL